MATARERLHGLLHHPTTRLGRGIELISIGLIFASIVVVVLESEPEIKAQHSHLFQLVEWIVTAAFTVEYALRLYAAPQRSRYAFSFLGIIDLLSILPLYLALFVPMAASGVVLSGLRLVRLLRLFGMRRLADQGGMLVHAIQASIPKVGLFVAAVAIVSVILGTCMYLLEGPTGVFNSIPKGMYWAIATLTTVGYGDIVPATTTGRMIASLVMVLGYGVIAVPVGIVSSDIAQSVEAYRKRLVCGECDARGHVPDAKYCRICAAPLSVGNVLNSSGSVQIVRPPP
jgi:voltage-gated potassium channel